MTAPNLPTSQASAIGELWRRVQILEAVAVTGGGGELDYAEITSNVTVNGSSGAPNTVISGNSVAYDGTTRVLVEFSSAIIAAGSQTMVVELYDGASLLGRLADTYPGVSTAVRCGTFLTPTAGSHTFHVKAWKNGGTDGIVAAASPYLPAWYRITVA